jgi:hypothetical protein
MFAGPTAVGLVVQGIILSWILKIEKKCDCSKDWRRDYMKYFTLFNILFAFVILFMSQRVILALGPPGMAVIGAAAFVNMFAILTYIPSLKKRNCSCALENEWRDNFIFWWTLIGALLMFIVPAVVVTKKLTH